jgi:predicted dehydrogenase
LVAAAVRRGINIFCEKPLARSFREAGEMCSTISHANVKNQVGLVLRYSPVYNVIKQLISNPDLGRPMSVLFRDDQYFPIRGIYGSTWRSDLDMAGGGALIEHSIHDADIMRWLFGEIRRISGIVKNFAGHRGIEDLASARFQFENGCVGHLDSVWHNIMKRESNRYMEIFFENGYICSDSDFIGPISYQMGSEDLCSISEDEVLERYISSIRLDRPEHKPLHSAQGLEDYHFLKALESDVRPSPDFTVALKAHEVVEAIYRAAEDGREIELPL